MRLFNVPLFRGNRGAPSIPSVGYNDNIIGTYDATPDRYWKLIARTTAPNTPPVPSASLPAIPGKRYVVTCITHSRTKGTQNGGVGGNAFIEAGAAHYVWIEYQNIENNSSDWPGVNGSTPIAPFTAHENMLLVLPVNTAIKISIAINTGTTENLILCAYGFINDA